MQNSNKPEEVSALLTRFKDEIGNTVARHIDSSIAEHRTPADPRNHGGLAAAAVGFAAFGPIGAVAGFLAGAGASKIFSKRNTNISDAKTTEIEDSIRDGAKTIVSEIKYNNNVIELVQKYTDRIKSIPGRTPDETSNLSEEAAGEASARFQRFLLKRGLAADEAQRFSELHSEFVQTELPEIGVLSAVQELRDQYHGKKTLLAPAYEGKRVHGDAVTYLKEHYGEAIRQGKIGTGQLAASDRRLYAGINYELSKQQSNMTISSLFDSLREVDKNAARGTAGLRSRRLDVCAAILGSGLKGAASFFGGLQGYDRSK